MTRGSLDEYDAPLGFKTAAAFCGEYVPLAYVLEPVVRTSSLYTVTARTGGGKTAFAIALTLAIATNRPELIGMPIEGGRIAYLTFENPDDFRMRLAVAAHAFGIKLGSLGTRYVVLDAKAPPEAIVAQLAAMAAADGPFILIIVDTLAAAFDGRDINDNVESGNFIRRMRPLTMLLGQPAVIIAAHPVKNAGEDNLVPYGGGAILNEVDGNLTLSKRVDTPLTTLHWCGKFRGLEFAPRSYRFDDATSPAIVDRHGRLVRLPVLRPVADVEKDEAEDGSAAVDMAIMRCLASDPAPALRAMVPLVGISKSAIAKRLKRLGRDRLIEQQISGRWTLSAKGRAQVG